MSWSDLSTKLKQNVVGRLDLMSRHALRCTSRANRYLVNDMDFFVPRVRISVKDSGILIMIHTGIDKFLRIEMWIGGEFDGKTIARKFQNSYDARHAIEKVLSASPSYHAARILCSLLSHKKLLIGTIEWEIERGFDVKKEEETESRFQATIKETRDLVGFFQKLSRKSKVFRANKLATSWKMTTEMEMILKRMFVASDLKQIERIHVALSEHSLTPLFSFDTYLPSSDGKGIRWGNANIAHECVNEILTTLVAMVVMSAGFGALRFAKFDEFAKSIWDDVSEPVTVLSDKLTTKLERSECSDGMITLFHQRSDCGYWIYAVLDSRSGGFNKSEFLNNSCGLGWMCKRCADPFEYDYYQNLGRRCVLEPEWNDMVLGEILISDPGSNIIEMATKRYEKDEMMMKRKILGTQKMWGFGDGIAFAEDSENTAIGYTKRRQDVLVGFVHKTKAKCGWEAGFDEQTCLEMYLQIESFYSE
ncbi:hypothetical protein GCK72_021725 [Caenorhabditis remanei]|uniref:F-box domain-containing protein n=1 Tax=Caenorhabditis remanei TaxID=31234 RepID=A0A6A5GKM5_CAERE|nr:hypothetical protein GCK72_021725 [Caenorhabditis remanei]KAF1755156.1 hypothetical protein GCK72_021725 [Caenorhabditis remanei]